MRLHLVDQEPEVVEALHHAFSPHPEVTVARGDILDLAEDTLVSPANGLGLMDGGIDLEYVTRLGADLQERVFQALAPLSEPLAPGQAIIVRTGDPRIRQLVVAPTVRVPGEADAKDVFFAMSAVLRTVAARRDLADIYCPGLGTGIGLLPPEEAAREMAAAYTVWLRRRDVICDPIPGTA